MDDFEKVEKLRERANVSYEDARDALKQANGDLLDAMVYLEKNGKVAKPSYTSYTTDATEQPEYKDVPQVVVTQQNNANGEDLGKKIGRFLKKAWVYGKSNYLVVNHHEERVVKLPLIIAALICLVSLPVTLILILVSLFFGFRYRCEGKNDMTTINKGFDKVSETANNMRDEFNKAE